MTENQAYLTLKETAEYLGIGYATAKRDWPEWTSRFGVRTSRYMGNTNSRLKFRRADLDRMMQQCAVA